VGSAHGRVFNTLPLYYPPNAAFTGKGELKLTGSEGSTSGYVGLPSGILSSLSEVSVEAWVTWTLRTAGWPWQRIFDFGSPATSSPNTYFFLTTEANTYTPGYDVARWTISTNGIDAETPRLDWTNILSLNVTSFVAVTYSPVRALPSFTSTANWPPPARPSFRCRELLTPTTGWAGRSMPSILILAAVTTNSACFKRPDVGCGCRGGLRRRPDTVGVDYVIHSFTSGTNLTLTWG